MTLSEKSASLWAEIAVRVLIGLVAAGVYEIDRAVFGLEQGLATVVTIVPMLWWGRVP